MDFWGVGVCFEKNSMYLINSLDFFCDFGDTALALKGRLAQLARAPARHAGGHRFKSRTAHFFMRI